MSQKGKVLQKLCNENWLCFSKVANFRLQDEFSRVDAYFSDKKSWEESVINECSIVWVSTFYHKTDSVWLNFDNIKMLYKFVSTIFFDTVE